MSGLVTNPICSAVKGDQVNEEVTGIFNRFLFCMSFSLYRCMYYLANIADHAFVMWNCSGWNYCLSYIPIPQVLSRYEMEVFSHEKT